MREEIKKVHTQEWVSHKYTCSRCNEPCGDSETRSSYDVLEAKIVLTNTEAVELTVAGDRLKIDKIHKTKVRILTKEGSSYPEGTNIDQKVIDCCTKCFEEIVLPALLALGFKVREENVSW